MDLTIPFVLWSLFWGLLAYITGSWVYVLVALAPWGFILVVVLLAVAVIFAQYRKGGVVTVTTPKTRRLYQRGRATIVESIDS